MKRLFRPRITEVEPTPQPQPAHRCAICNSPAVVRETLPGIAAHDAPGALRVSERGASSRPEAAALLPATLHFCSECLTEIEKYIVFLIEQHTLRSRQDALAQRLVDIGAGPIITAFSATPCALPPREVQRALEGTPYSDIWDH